MEWMVGRERRVWVGHIQGDEDKGEDEKLSEPEYIEVSLSSQYT